MNRDKRWQRILSERRAASTPCAGPLAVLSMADAAPLAWLRQRLIRQGALNQPLGLVTTTLAGPSGHHGHLVSAATAAFREPPSTVAATTSGSSTATASVATATAFIATATAPVAAATTSVATATAAAAPSDGQQIANPRGGEPKARATR